MGDLAGKVALITGAARGIGFAIAKECAAAGARVIIGDLHFAAAENSATQIRKLGGEASPLLLDVTQETAAEQVIATAINDFGGLDILVNNAGIHSESPERPSTTADFFRCLDVNLIGAWRMANAVTPHFKAQRHGKIVNIASVNGRLPWAETPAYSASKAGLINLTRSLAMTLGPYGINVNAVCPGGVVTDMARALFQDTTALESRLTSTRALKRALSAEDIALATVFFASDRARNVTGQALNVDGGGIFN